jgi:hypothetical protein
VSWLERAKVRKPKTTKANVPDFSNQEMVVLATYLAGGRKAYADTEDIAVKANEISPGRFTWRRYKEQINIDTVRKRLWDASKVEKGGYLVGSERDGWLLTRAGLKFCEKNLRTIKHGTAYKERHTKRERSWFDKERVRMLAEPAYCKLLAGKFKEITPVEAERFFRVDDYVVGEARKTKIQRTIAAFQSDPDLAKAIKKIAAIVREK